MSITYVNYDLPLDLDKIKDLPTKIKALENLKVNFDYLDPESEYYVVCLECKRPFMSDRLGRKFCCRKHANAYNNRLKREELGLKRKLTNLVLKENLKSMEIFTKPENKTAAISVIEEPTPNLQSTPNTEAASLALVLPTNKEFNNQLLKSLLGNKKDIQVSWEWMVSSNFNFRDYDSIEQLRGCERNKINYGDYSLIWVNADQVFITLQKNLLFTNPS